MGAIAEQRAAAFYGRSRIVIPGDFEKRLIYNPLSIF
jgi:hypothetical protein